MVGSSLWIADIRNRNVMKNFFVISLFVLGICHNVKAEDIVANGDANGDGEIDAADIVEVVNDIMGRPSNLIKKGADANGDGIVNAADIVTIVNIITNNSDQDTIITSNEDLDYEDLITMDE